MCVIVYKPAGVFMPSDRIIEACASANRDGFGFCTPATSFKSVSFNSFKRQLDKVRYDEPCIIHFRLATHGSIKKANCHPFHLGDVFFAHNGILNVWPMKDKTDSETAFIRYLYPNIEHYGLFSQKTDEVVKNIIGSSKFAFMQGDNVRLFGYFEKMGDCYYSNLRFIPYLYH